MNNFIIYGLPRSRTYWLSRFLNYGDWLCGHDELLHCRSMEDIASWLSQPNTGTVETLAAPFWRHVRDIRTVVVRRPVEAVQASLSRLNFPDIRPYLHKMDHKLDQIEKRVPNTLSVSFEDLNTLATCRQVFEFCLPYKFDKKWWKHVSRVNLQVNMEHVVRYYSAHESQLIKLAKTAKHHILHGMSKRHVEIDQDDGLTIREEPLAALLQDGQAMISEHLVLVGESPDNCGSKNLELMQALEDKGNLQVITARANGRIFGYLVAVVSPSLESPDITIAVHTMFYGSPDFKGLGMKLQRHSIEALRSKGVDEIYLHAGIRGMGPRMGTLFRRLGAEEFGSLYKLTVSN